MTPEQRKILEEFIDRPLTVISAPKDIYRLAGSIRAALDEIDTMNPPMPIDQYSPEQRRRHAEQNRRANEAFFYGMQE